MPFMVEVTGTAKAVATKILLVDDDDEVRRVLTHRAEQRQPIHARHADVAHHRVVSAAL